MVGSEEVTWEKEQIPERDSLYYRVHVAIVPDGDLHPGVFREQGDSMSTDWAKYSTPEASRGRATEPDKNGIVELMAGPVRAIEGMIVEHSPDVTRDNRAHTDIRGMSTAMGKLSVDARKTFIRRELFATFNQWLIHPNPSGGSLT